MKQLLERTEIKRERLDSDEGEDEDERPPTTTQNQAYFCRKCYQVFFKLDEFNVHVVGCKGTAYTTNNKGYHHGPKHSLMMHHERGGGGGAVNSEPEKFSPTGRPMRNCVKEISTYADDPTEELEMPQLRRMHAGKSPRGFECTMCSSCFPTVHSRNSHMRIHKAAIQQLNALSRKSINIVRTRPGAGAAQAPPSYVGGGVTIKQEPMEPIVEIHEQPANNSFPPSSIGSVSITPIVPNDRSRQLPVPRLDPNIMRLVRNNPNLTIKSMQRGGGGDGGGTGGGAKAATTTPPPPDGDVKCYRCLSCSKPFANKSNLYFHKKNQCSGSKYPCPFCKKRFGTEAAYSSHIFYNHPE